jgi:hypothetical protein
MRSLNTLSLIGASHRLSHACDARSHDPGNSQCYCSDIYIIERKSVCLFLRFRGSKLLGSFITFF